MYLLKALSTIIFITIGSLPIFSQSSTSWKWEPHISLTWYPSDRWSFHGEVGSLQTLRQNTAKGLGVGATERLEVQLFSTYRLFSDSRISLGFLHRLINPFEPGAGNEYRLIQQFAFVFHRLPFRIVNRIRMEQRFLKNDFLNRFRYRFSYDMPLKGLELDVGEPFLKGTNEIILAINDNRSEWENRTTAGVGWLLKNRNKLEVNLQYRATAIGSDNQKEGVYLLTTFYISFAPE